MKKILKFAVVFTLLFTIFIYPQNYSKAEEISLKITPLTFKFNIEKGKSESSVVSIINPNQVEIKVISSVEDFLQGDEEGTPRFIKNEVNEETLSDWIKIDNNEINIKPNEKKDISFEISVPQNAASGGHYAAIFFQNINNQKEDNQISVAGRVGSLILITVPGDFSMSGEIVEFNQEKYYQKGPIDFGLRFKNTGKTHFQTSGIIKIKNTLGKEIAILDLPEHIILPDSIRKFETKWEAKNAFGRYEAIAEIKDGDGNLKIAKDTFYIINWMIIIPIIILLFILIAIILIIKRIKNKKNRIEKVYRG